MSSIPSRFYTEKRWVVMCENAYGTTAVMNGNFMGDTYGHEDAERLAKRLQVANDEDRVKRVPCAGRKK